jgi:hypothetical protein
MRCYTLVIGGVPEEGIRLSMDPGDSVPGVVVGPREHGLVVPVDSAWFKTIVDLQQNALQLQECHGKSLGLPLITHCELEGENLEDDGDRKAFVLHSRSGRDKDRRVLIHLLPPEGERVRYTGCHKIESYDKDTQKVTRQYPKLDDVVGIELIAGTHGEALIIMHPGASFRVTRSKSSHHPDFHLYMLIASRSPKIKELIPSRHSRPDRAA